MTLSKIDWVVMWKLFHYQFCWVYLSLGVLIRLVFAARVKTVSLGKTILFAVASSSVASLVSTWFPVVPIIGGAIVIFVVGHGAGEFILISVPIVAVSLGIETAFVDAILFRLLMKGPVTVRFGALLIMNILNATIALVLGLAWAFGHMPTFVAALDNCC